MFARIQTWWGLAVAAAAAALWGLNLTLLQPLAATARYAPHGAENTSYWARDLRIDAIVAAVCALILVARGNRARSALAGVGGVAWLGIDVVLDRSGVSATLPVVAAAVVFVLLFGVGSGRASRLPLLLAASISSGLAPLAAMTDSPTDAEPGLASAALATTAILVLAAAGCGLAVSPVRSRAQTAAVVAATLATIGVATLARLEFGDLWAILVCVPFVSVVALTVLRSSPYAADRLGEFGFSLAVLVAYVLALVVFAVLTVLMPWPAMMLTALAGNPPIDAAVDTDTISAFFGCAAGLVMGLALAWLTRAEARRPMVAAPVTSTV